MISHYKGANDLLMVSIQTFSFSTTSVQTHTLIVIGNANTSYKRLGMYCFKRVIRPPSANKRVIGIRLFYGEMQVTTAWNEVTVLLINVINPYIRRPYILSI